jgi:hypothetical protein
VLKKGVSSLGLYAVEDLMTRISRTWRWGGEGTSREDPRTIKRDCSLRRLYNDICGSDKPRTSVIPSPPWGERDWGQAPVKTCVLKKFLFLMGKVGRPRHQSGITPTSRSSLPAREQHYTAIQSSLTMTSCIPVAQHINTIPHQFHGTYGREYK